MHTEDKQRGSETLIELMLRIRLVLFTYGKRDFRFDVQLVQSPYIVEQIA